MSLLARNLPRSFPRLYTPLSTTLQFRSFHQTTVNMVKTGDSIPSQELFENTPGTKVDLSKELKGKGLIIGVPAAFSSVSHSLRTINCLLRVP